MIPEGISKRLAWFGGGGDFSLGEMTSSLLESSNPRIHYDFWIAGVVGLGWEGGSAVGTGVGESPSHFN